MRTFLYYRRAPTRERVFLTCRMCVPALRVALNAGPLSRADVTHDLCTCGDANVEVYDGGPRTAGGPGETYFNSEVRARRGPWVYR